MEGAGHFRRLIVLAAALPSVGCVYAEGRLRDFADIFRFQGQVGYGLRAHVNAGELAHVGVGTSRQWYAGTAYGTWDSGESVEDHFPLSYVWTLLEPDRAHVHRTRFAPRGEQGAHRCYLLFPGALNPGQVEKNEIHYLDVEVGFLAGFIGAEIGVSIGELFDFLVGLFKFSEDWAALDVAGDDPPAVRAERKLWLPRRRKEGLPPPN